MFEMTIAPRYSETDAMGHIGNTVLPVWFEAARKPIFELVHPAMSLPDWPIIVARLELDYRRQICVDHEVLVLTGMDRIGTKSFTVFQQARQNGELMAEGKAVHVYFDYATATTKPLPPAVKDRLKRHRFERDFEHES